MDNVNNKDFSDNIFTAKYGFSPANPFSNTSMPEIKAEVETAKKTVTNPVKRLNGYDSTILNSASLEGSSDENLSLEYRIKEKEAQISDINGKILTAEKYGTQNESLGLKAKRQRLYEELNSLRRQYSMNINPLNDSKSFHQSFKTKMPLLYKAHEFISRQFLAKVSKKVNSVVTLSDSLEQLSQISRSVDELIDMNVPYGEKIQNYEKLTEYLNQANIIHSKISKSLKR